MKFVKKSHEIRTIFVRIFYEFRTNFVRIYVNFFKLHANHSRESVSVCGRGMVETLR